ncbi:MAG: protein kinase [Labilithrix sp.]|nr:protein kinase [Labilithrix sp.]
MLAPGHVIDRYELVCPIGDGGTAHVWAARQRGAHGFAKLVAVKVIHSRLAEDAAFRRTFLDEARVVSEVRHRNVAEVLDLGETGSLLYLVTEYVDGASLSALTAPSRTVPVPIALRIAADMCRGLSAVHALADATGRSHGLVHGDVSPENVLLAASGDVKLLAFGVARAHGRHAAATAAGVGDASVRYMAPEQARREALGPYTDVFGVGATLYRMLAGRAPYAAESDALTTEALIASAPPRTPLPATTSPALAEVIGRAIAPRVGARYADARQLGDALEELLLAEGRPPDVAAWVQANLDEGARERRARLLARANDDAAQPAGRPVPALATTASPRPEPSVAKAPGFMDVGALVARASSSDADAPVARGSSSDADAPEPRDAPADGAAPNDAGASPAPAKKPAAIDPPARSRRALVLAVGVLVLVAAAIAFLLLLPAIVRDRVIAGAREAGFEVTVERVGVGFGGITLRGITAKATRTPGVSARIQEVHLVGLSAKEARVHGLDARLEGPRTDLEIGIASLVADNRQRLAGTPAAPRHVSIVGARLTWNGADGERLAASDIGLELDSHGAGVEDLRASVGRFELASPKATLGPWASSFERSAGASRLRVAFDPPVPDGPSALVVWPRTGPTEVTVTIPRSSFQDLGVRPSELGLPAEDGTDVQLSLRGTLSEAARSELTFEATVWGLRPKGFASALEVRVEGAAASADGKPFDLTKTSVVVGPFTAGVTGTVTPHARGFRVDAMFKTIPMPCERLARAEAKNMGPLAATLQALGQTTGALRVTGAVNAAGVVTYDTAEPEGATLTWMAKETCGVSIFGR